MDQYFLHQVEWDDKRVKRFWNFYNNYKAFDDLWFSKTVGREIIKFVKAFKNIGGNVLDYGIGKGHLSNYLMEDSKVELFACDFSNDTVQNNNKQFELRPNFRGCFLVNEFPSGFQENKFDFVFLVEAIEHLTDDYLLPTLKEIRRILKPDGIIIVTTPNDERLDLQHVSCPDCGCIYHRVQHVRSFTDQSLAIIMESQAFTKMFCHSVNFEELKNSFLHRKLKSLARYIINSKYKNPHLVYIGKK
jgi:SAM-dependent methyltransferase